MKKRKTYEVSIIDKTYSKIISDETKFYTSDTALELVFKLKETEYTFESAEIVLLNIDDRSLTTRPVSKSLNSFTYELDDDVIPHYGEWHCQVRFEQGETYVSSPVKFRIENDLSNERPPQLSDVQSWVSLKRYADSLTEDLKQAVLSVEGIEDAFNENETVRQTQFETAEQSRQTTFETNESERDETFETNETVRQTQELERVGAEGQRQSVFDNNEVNRTETFNTNEAARQENETTRQQAESIRASAEEQRKIDHANRSAELAGKADKVVLKNLVKNGDFSDGTTGWMQSGYFTGFEVIDGVAKTTYFDSRSASFIQSLSEQQNTGDIMYVSIRTRVDNPDKFNNLYLLSNYAITDNNIVGPVHNVGTDFVQISGTIKYKDTFILRVLYNFRELGEYPAYLDDVVTVNLTKTFGVGNEPTKEEMDELIKVTGYIDGEYALNNKEMLIWTLALIRRNKNAILTLGGTI